MTLRGIKPEHLRVLGLPNSATFEEARQSYRELIRVWYPDRFEQDPPLRKRAEEETKKLNQAWDAVKALSRHVPSKDNFQSAPESIKQKAPPPREPIVVYPRFSTLVFLIICSLFFGVTGTLIVLVDRVHPIFLRAFLGGLSFIFGLMGFGVTFDKLVRRRPSLVINEAGIFATGAGVLEWDEVFEVKILDFSGDLFLGIVATTGFIKRQSWWRRIRLRTSRFTGGAHFNIPQLLLSVPVQDLMATINQYRRPPHVGST